jgi:hypothetical protein
MKRAFLIATATVLMSSPAHACGFFDGYDAATGEWMVIATAPEIHLARAPLPVGKEFYFRDRSGEYTCFTQSLGSGMQTREAICETGDGVELKVPITWVDFESDPMLRAAVFNGYVFYPGCDL